MEDTKENRIRFASLMGELGLAFRVDTPKDTMAVYFKYLHDRSMYQVEHAIIDLVKVGDRFPTVSKLREIAGSFREFKTAEKTESIQIEEFTGADYKPENADEFFKKIMEDF